MTSVLCHTRPGYGGLWSSARLCNLRGPDGYRERKGCWKPEPSLLPAQTARRWYGMNVLLHTYGIAPPSAC